MKKPAPKKTTDELQRVIEDLREMLALEQRKLRSERTRHALAEAKLRGVKLGGLNARGIKNRDEAATRAAELRPVLKKLAHLSAHKIAKILNARGVKTPTGKVWYAATVIRVQNRIKQLPE